MKKPLLPVVLALMLFPSLSALAQTPAPATPVVPAIPAGDAPAVPQDMAPPSPAPEAGAPPDALPPPPPPVPSDPGAPTVEDRLGAVEGKVDGLDESYAGTKSTVEKLNRIKFSGYIQGRFENRGNSVNGVMANGTAATTTQFLVRRARLKLNYDGTNAEYVFQIDATGAGVSLRDAEATFVDTWTPFGFRLTVGQFKWPFGYEILQSSGDREMPERAAVITALFPGERDRGVRLTGRYEFLRFAVALVNGAGTSVAPFQNNDQNTFKDVVGRIGGDFEFLAIGLSGYWGRPLIPSALATTTSVTGMDTNMNGTFNPGELTATTSTNPFTYTRFARERIGADAQLYFDVPELGGLALKGEFIWAKDTNLDFGAVAAKPCLDTTAMGWIGTLVQNVGDRVGIVGRIDYYDPIRAKSLPDSCQVTPPMMAAQKRGAGDGVLSFGGGLLLHGSGNIKATFVYLHTSEQSTTVKNDIFTAQLQARF
ncbi:MAG: hypothetical protein H7X95_00190 [Deltaproteobacteria bacterium]|nr:hypothetical protein [Deltaproteobacteria bacterium]